MPKRQPPKRRRPVRQSTAAILSDALELHQRGNLSQAERLYKTLLDSDPRQSNVHHLLGRLYFDTNRPEQAIDSLRRALDLRGKYAEGLLDLANMLSEVGQWSAAEASLRELIQLRPDDAMAFNNLGLVLKDQSSFADAETALRRSLELAPDNVETLCNLAQVCVQTENPDEAITLWRRAIAIEPECSAAYGGLASVLRRQGSHDAAREVFAAWIRIEPDNPVPHHLFAAYDPAAVPTRASDGYVRQVFDQFAATFDQDLQRLEYRGPQVIQEALQRAYPSGQGVDLVLDAGCGTGLCGEILRAYGRNLIGVDLSQKMLEVADQRRVYDQLVEAELCSYLTGHPATFDLIVCTDTLGYFGELNAVFLAAREALCPRGRLVATVELGSHDSLPGYQLQASGRYSHNRQYIFDSCRLAGLTVAQSTEETMRREADQHVSVIVLTAEACNA
jgi:predicted TPR repeat methyltransferase